MIHPGRSWSLALLSVSFLAERAPAAPPTLPAGYPSAQYDEDKVPSYTLPDPLVTLSAERVSSPAAWPARRKEILGLFARYIYGITPVGRPPSLSWSVEPGASPAAPDSLRRKDVTLLFNGRPDGPKMRVRLFLPAAGRGPVPVFLMAGSGFFPGRPNTGDPAATASVVARGYGLITCDLSMVDPDRKGAYAQGIRAYYSGTEEKDAPADAWGTLSSWAWAMSRAMDYIETDADIDASRVAVMGVSRYGKAAVWAGAQDERFAAVISSVSGCCGATLVRRGYGETVASITGYAPYWFCSGFRDYASRVGDLPVDWHMLIAAIAPRPLYIATAEQDYWNDPHGQFLAAIAAEPVYRLLGTTGLGTTQAPAVNIPVGETVRYHCRSGGHGLTDFDWSQFLDFADTHFGRPPGPKSVL
jgi:hypothetical protein